jgi:predicted nucleic acid-binding Zn finger protein
VRGTTPTQTDKERLTSRFANAAENQAQLGRAADAALNGCVKEHIFTPSGRVVFTVVGRSGDEFIDPAKPFCSCSHFFFRVLGGRDQTCYHLLAYEMAKESHGFAKTEFHDEEFSPFLRLLSLDLMDQSRDKEDKDNQEPSDNRPR